MNTSNQCGKCIYFNRLHQCCGVRLNEEGNINSYLHREPTSEACKDFNIPDLPEFVQTKPTKKDLAMSDDDRDWRSLPIVHLYAESDRVRIVGTVEGLGDLLYAIATAMGKGSGLGGLLLSNSVRYPVIVERKDHESEWRSLNVPAINPPPNEIGPYDLDELDIDFRDIF
ncbi:MAG: hypothetical protein HC851_15135 [Acaryochloris sp. RU_4_1]|nr:hypothetical protein [Acaryochloris sp. RU_4_1]NJR56048.1 hypothetical protein [Acaryochloris sp. CRU_2_0]